MNDMQCFVRVVELGSFAAAAEEMALSPSAVSKIISRIEDRLRVRLLTRTTRRLALTAEGQIYLARCREILKAIEAMESELGEASSKPHGLIRINTGTAIGKHALTPLLPEFLALYPDIRIELSITDRQIDLVAENVDLVLRTGQLADSALHAVLLGEGCRLICASPDYLARRGVPQVPADLMNHNCLVLSHVPRLAQWPFHTPEGINRLGVRGDVAADSADILLDLALQGHGVTRLGNLLVDRALAEGRLVALLRDMHEIEPFPIWGVMPAGRFRLPRLRVFLDFLREKFKSSAASAP
jgi:DNA-binding transcriptional LysR family regulator